MKIELSNLRNVEKSELIELMNNPRLKKHMPLLSNAFSKRDYDAFIVSKDLIWQQCGYGPWAILLDGQFAGWGGLQPENGEPDLALVLHPHFWGRGKAIYRLLIDRAFGESKLPSVTVHLPKSRTRLKGLIKLGFIHVGDFNINEETFMRFRLLNNGHNKAQ